MAADCPLCKAPTHEVLWQDDFCRIVLLDDQDYPAYCRVELLKHIKEMSDLPPAERARMMKVVFATETTLRETLNPEKINLASFGNMTPHVHWHVIPRFTDDKHFPNSYWGEPVRDANAKPMSSAQQSTLTARMQELIHCALK